MGSAESFGGDAVAKKVGRQSGGACSSGVRKEIQAVNGSAPVLSGKIPDAELCRQAYRSPSVLDNDVTKDCGMDFSKSPSLALDLGVKVVFGKTCKIPRSTNLCTKRSGALMEVSRSKSRLLDIDGMSPEVSLYPGSRTISEKTQIVKQRNCSNARSGDKRNKPHKNRCDAISVKNGLISFNSAPGGNNFFGLYGLKSDVVDITKFVNEIPLDELLHGNYGTPSLAKDKGKKAVTSNSGLLQSVRKAYSVLQSRKVLQTEKCAETDHSSNKMVSSSLVIAGSTANQIDGEKEDSCAADLSSSDKVQEPVGKMKESASIVDSPLHKPNDILERLTLSLHKDLESLLFDAGKPTLSSKNSNLRVGLPPFPWSHSFTGHNKLGADSAKLTASRTACHGRWVKVTSSTMLQNCSVNLPVDLESLIFDSSLVPEKFKTLHSANEIATTSVPSFSSGACPTSKIPEDEHSPTYAAAQALCEMATRSSKTVHVLRKPSHSAMKTCKLKTVEKSDKMLNAPKLTETSNLIKVCDVEFPSKKLKLSTDVGSTYIDHTDSPTKGVLNWSTPHPARSSSTKLFREAKAEIDSYNVNHVKKPHVMKPPKAADRPGISQQKLKKVFPMKWNRPEG